MASRRRLNGHPPAIGSADDAWAHRELALIWLTTVAPRPSPNSRSPETRTRSPSYYYTLGHALNRDDRPRDARELEEAVRAR